MKTFRLEVLVPVRNARSLILLSEHADGAPPAVRMEKRTLRETVYVWSTREDVWSGILDGEQRQALQKTLSTTFNLATPEMERGPVALDAFTQALTDAAGDASQWAMSGQTTEEEAESMLRFNPTSAIATHLSWVADVFRDVPGVSFAIS